MRDLRQSCPEDLLYLAMATVLTGAVLTRISSVNKVFRNLDQFCFTGEHGTAGRTHGTYKTLDFDASEDQPFTSATIGIFSVLWLALYS